MLSASSVTAVIGVKDLAAAKEFYEGTLGLQSTGEDEPGGVLYGGAEGSRLLVYETQFGASNPATSASWRVEDLDAEIAGLQSKGVTFEEYDLDGVERDGPVHKIYDLRAAWFKDPEGNILNIVSRG